MELAENKRYSKRVCGRIARREIGFRKGLSSQFVRR
jgi:hypothetical protein